MKNYLDDGDTIPIASMPEAADSGEFLIVGDLMGVAVGAFDSGAAGTLKRTGVFWLPKTTSEAWTQGQKLFWNVSTKKFTIDSSKLPVSAIAWVAALSADTEGKVLLAGPQLKTVGGLATTVAASDTIVTGLTKLLGVVAGLNDAPTDALAAVNADIGDQAGSPAAGSFLLKTWKNTSGTDPTPLAATAFGAKVAWLAFGY